MLLSCIPYSCPFSALTAFRNPRCSYLFFTPTFLMASSQPSLLTSCVLEKGTPSVTGRFSRAPSSCATHLHPKKIVQLQHPFCPFTGSPRERVVKFALHLSIKCKPAWADLLGVSEPTLSLSIDNTLATDVTG